MDPQLIIRAQRGDEDAFAQIVALAGGRLHAIAHRVLRDPELAEDATQQALLMIWRDLPRLREPARFNAWSYRLLIRACYRAGREARHWMPDLHLLPNDRPIGTDEMSRILDRDEIERAFRRLSVAHRAVVVLHHYMDMPLTEVAEALDIPMGTVRSRLHYAVRAMRASLDADARPVAKEIAS
ncbi:MAG TPA: sigma-70 family RNA polymerase sigma factor [Candidatus Limnocylindria bacterium]|nr:sigma-70 family RNA polymerase sigma factor [Candidatus Limnocylindria bacterium]